MAMIKCPECEQEISDKAKKCIHCGKVLFEEKPKTKICSECKKELDEEAVECPFCGYPLEQEEAVRSTSTKKQKPKTKKLLIPIIAVVTIMIIVVGVYILMVVKPKNTYSEAISLLEQGKYDDANKLFDSISSYKDVEEIQEQLKYESYSYSAINSLKKNLKNPDSYQPYEITFYSSLGENNDSSKDNLGDDLENEKYPICIMHYGAQNGFGGTTASYAICSYVEEDKEYKPFGTCNSLNENKYDENDTDDAFELLICRVINLFRDGDDTIGNIDMTRLKKVLKNDVYSTIKIID